MRIGKKTKVAREITRQEQNRKNNIRRIAVSAAAALIVFIALVIVEKSILNQEETAQVYQVVKDVESGTKVTDKNFDKIFALKDVQVSLIPEGYIIDKADIMDKFVNRNYKANDIVTTDGITDTEANYKNSIENPIEISFSVESLSTAVAGTIREGDYINIYGMRKIGGDEGNADAVSVDTAYTFKHVYVEQAFDGSGNRITSDGAAESEQSTVTMFLLVLNEKDAPHFYEMLENCTIKLVKLQYDTTQDYQVFLEKSNTDTGYKETTTDEIVTEPEVVEDNTDTSANSIDNVTPGTDDTADDTESNATSTQDMINNAVNSITDATTPEAGANGGTIQE